MVMTGCQGKPQVTFEERICPQCGNEVELCSVDAEAVCDVCGFVIYNDQVNCAKWCDKAEECFGPEIYANLRKIIDRQAAEEAAGADDEW